LLARLETLPPTSPRTPAEWHEPTFAQIQDTQREVRRILNLAGYTEPVRRRALQRVDALVMHPVAGPLILAALLFFVFQAVFSWAAAPMALVDAGISWIGAQLHQALPPGALNSLLVDGVIAGAGSVLVFLPQILILFFFILVLEDSGYLPRAAYLLDRMMGSVGLSGRAFIPLLSSFACAVPGIMATRTIPNVRDRIATIMIAPLMTCSARLPVYALIIAAFIPNRPVGAFNLQGLVLFTLYVAGIVAAMAAGIGLIAVAVVVADDVPAEVVRQALVAGGGELLESVRLFDTYSGEQVGAGRTSLAFALRMRAPDRTLSAAEVADVRQSALAAAEQRCGAVLRT